MVLRASIHMIKDMCSGTRFGSSNLAVNQCCWDSCARASMFSMPMFSFFNFNQYSSFGGAYNFLLNPWFAYAQTMWSFAQNSWNYTNNFSYNGSSIFSASGSSYTNNFSYNGSNIFSASSPSYINSFSSYNNCFAPGLTNTPTASAEPKTDAEKAEEERIKKENKEYEKKLNDLYNHLKLIAKYETRNEDESVLKEYTDVFDSIKTDKNKTNKEKYEALLEEYKNLKEDGTVLKYIINGSSMSVSSLGADATDNEKTQLNHHLDKIGFERNTNADNDYESVVNALINLKNGNIKGQDFSCIEKYSNDETALKGEILDIISSENSMLAAKGEKYTIMGLLKDLHDKKDLDDTYKNAVSNMITKYKNALIDLSKEYSKMESDLNEASKDELSTAIRELNSITIDSGKSEDRENFVNKFNTLYAYMRAITSKELSRKLAKYNEYDPDLYTNNLFFNGNIENNTLEDLKSENIKNSDIMIAEILDSDKKIDRKDREEKNKKDKQKIESIHFFAQFQFPVEETDLVLIIDGEKHTIYKEPSTERLFTYRTVNGQKRLAEVYPPTESQTQYTVSKGLDENKVKEISASILRKRSIENIDDVDMDSIKELVTKLYASNGGFKAMFKEYTSDSGWKDFTNAVDYDVNPSNVLYVVKQYNYNYVESSEAKRKAGIAANYDGNRMFTELLSEKRNDREVYAKKLLEDIIVAAQQKVDSLPADSETAKEVQKYINELTEHKNNLTHNTYGKPIDTCVYYILQLLGISPVIEP